MGQGTSVRQYVSTSVRQYASKHVHSLYAIAHPEHAQALLVLSTPSTCPRYVTVWNFRGEMVTRFEDHVLWHPDSNTNNIYITSTQDYIFSYCRR